MPRLRRRRCERFAKRLPVYDDFRNEPRKVVRRKSRCVHEIPKRADIFRRVNVILDPAQKYRKTLPVLRPIRRLQRSHIRRRTHRLHKPDFRIEIVEPILKTRRDEALDFLSRIMPAHRFRKKQRRPAQD